MIAGAAIGARLCYRT